MVVQVQCSAHVWVESGGTHPYNKGKDASHATLSLIQDHSFNHWVVASYDLVMGSVVGNLIITYILHFILLHRHDVSIINRSDTKRS